MNFLIKLFLLLIIMSGISCDDRGKTIVKGRVLNAITNEPVTDLRIVVREYPFHSGMRTAEDFYSDANGEFYAQFRARKSSDYYCEIYDGWSYLSDEESNILVKNVAVSKGNEQDITFYICPIAKFRLILNNINCFDVNDNISVDVTSGLQNWNKNYQYPGCGSVDMLDYIEYPYGNIYFHWQVTRNSLTQNFYDTLYLNKNEEKIYQIDY